MKAAYSLDELELILQNCGFLIYERLDHEEIAGQYFEDYNAKNPRHIMQAPEGVGSIPYHGRNGARKHAGVHAEGQSGVNSSGISDNVAALCEQLLKLSGCK